MDRPDFNSIAAQAAFQPVEGGAVIFHAPSKRLFALNAVAAFVWASMGEGLGPQEIRRGLSATFRITGGQADEWFELALDTFFGVWTAGAEPPPLDEAGIRAATQERGGVDYRLFDKILRVAAPGLAITALDDLLAGLRIGGNGLEIGADAPDLLLEIEAVDDGYRLTSAGEWLSTVAPNGLVAAVEQAIIQAIVPETPHLLAFHAAMLERQGHAVLLPAPSGSGKTTLSALLAARGWRYGSDELVLCDRDLRWRALPFPPCIKAENYALVETWHPRLAEAREHERFARKVKFLPLAVEALAAPVSHVVFPFYQPDLETGLVATDKMTGLSELLAQAVYVPAGFDERAVASLVRWHERAAYYRLCYSDPVQAAEMLEKMPLSGLEWHQP
ncbi:hypothetical protein [Mesorhizobium sp. INR15]|uniref:hypothetical protein n=1 Tax=Mesorhizobium sp. INR15 TaxID=2654248 RepID=UPI001896497B|nr:hypothetical protein [Mesorhizobium sp. INR15]QPC95460.1 hypothetical protein GA829_33170 [Mesorhizobium sp. INR15]